MSKTLKEACERSGATVENTNQRFENECVNCIEYLDPTVLLGYYRCKIEFIRGVNLVNRRPWMWALGVGVVGLILGVASLRLMARPSSWALIAAEPVNKPIDEALVGRPRPAEPTKENLERGNWQLVESSGQALFPETGTTLQSPVETLSISVEADSGLITLQAHKYSSPAGHVTLILAPGETRASIHQGGGLYVLEADSRLFTIDPETGATRSVTPNSIQGLDRNKVLQAARERGVLDPLSWADDPLISPDGRFISYLSNRRTFRESTDTGSTALSNDLWVYGVESGAHYLAAQDVASAPLYWLDGQRIAYAAETSGTRPYQVYAFSVDARQAEPVGDGLQQLAGAGQPGFAGVERVDGPTTLSLYGWDGSLRGTFAQDTIHIPVHFDEIGNLCLVATHAGQPGLYVHILDENLQSVLVAEPPNGHLLLQLLGWWGDRCIITTTPRGSAAEFTWALEVSSSD